MWIVVALFIASVALGLIVVALLRQPPNPYDAWEKKPVLYIPKRGE